MNPKLLADLVAEMPQRARALLASADDAGRIRCDGWLEYMACLLLANRGLSSSWVPVTDAGCEVLVLNEAGREVARAVGWGGVV